MHPGGNPRPERTPFAQKGNRRAMAAAAAAALMEGWLQRKRKSEWRKTYARLRPDALALFANQGVRGDLCALADSSAG